MAMDMGPRMTERLTQPPFRPHDRIDRILYIDAQMRARSADNIGDAVNAVEAVGTIGLGLVDQHAA
jgi:hypothetical protein